MTLGIPMTIAHLKRLLAHPLFIALFAFTARFTIISFAWLHAPTPVKAFLPFGWEVGHVGSAIAAGRGFSSPLRFVETGPTAWFTPIYPYFVAGIFKIWGIFSPASKLVLQTSNCVFAALTVIPIYTIAEKTFGKGIAIGGCWAWVLLPTSLLFPLYWIWDTTLAALLLALIVMATLSMPQARTVKAWVGYGSLCAVGVLVNPSLLSVLPFLAGWAVWRTRDASLPWMKFAVASLAVFTLAMVPWTVRNYRVFGKVIVLRSNFGLELWLGNNPAVPDTWSPWLQPDNSREEAEKYKAMGEMAFMEEKQREAISFMRTHPADTLNFIFRRFINTWIAITDTPADGWSSSPLYLKGFIVLNALLALFTLLGALFAHRTRPMEAAPLLLVLLFFPIVFYLTHSSLRYRFPMDPVMMVVAAYGVAYPISSLAGRLSRQRNGLTPAPTVVSR